MALARRVRDASGSDANGTGCGGRAMAREAVGRPPEETLSLWKREQALLRARVVTRDTEAWQRDPAFSGLQRVGGVDVSFVKGDSVRACASLVVLSYPELQVVYEDCRMVGLTAPYVSGFLAFRELPSLVDAVQRLREKEPHLMPQAGPPCRWKWGAPPPRFWGGLPPRRPHRPALHRGGQEAPAGGRAGEQRPAQGEDTPPADWRGHISSDGRLRGHPGHGQAAGRCPNSAAGTPCPNAPGCHPGQVASPAARSALPSLSSSQALKSHDHSTKPLYVSVGHKVSLETAVRLTRSCCRFRIPEPVRQEPEGAETRGVPQGRLRRAHG
ncbi:endonuclease V isoform X3 [Rhinolophus sinicus]|uniref:endonuclease V isoform X3 n=1 Tax=Rhinolophus sinicus TaxID=89399 RepID=UPI003D792D1E